MDTLDQPQQPQSEKTATETPKIPTTAEICEHFLGEIDWRGLDGYCKCPGEHLHTHATGKKDCKIYTSGKIPSVTCFHDKCFDAVQAANKEIRNVWSLYQPELPPEEVAAYKERAAKKKMLIEKARQSLPDILKRFAWTMDDMARECPSLAEETNTQQWHKFLELYDDNDVLWVGDPESTGSSIHAARFRRVVEWKYTPEPVGQFTCPSVFKRGVWSRSNANVVSTPYLVLECDAVLGECKTDEDKVANMNACGAIFRWLREAVGLDLRQVVTSGNKSLHAWVRMPTEAILEDLKVILPELGVDRISFKPAQPMRVAGGTRVFKDGRTVSQRVLWRAV